MIASAAVLFGARGIEATSFPEILAASGAPRGSIYYHFPKGKRQLVEDALRWTTEQLLRFQLEGPVHRAEEVLDRFVMFFRRSVVVSHCRAGCPVAAVAASHYGGEAALAALVRATFRSWTRVLTRQLRKVGVPPARARALATTTLASVEGALILCRAEGSVAPLDAVRREIRALVRTWAPRNPRGKGSRAVARARPDDGIGARRAAGS